METFQVINIFLIVAGFVMIFSELLLGIDSLFDLVLSGISLIIGGGIGFLLSSSIIGLLVTVVVLVGYWFLGRSYVHSRLNVTIRKSNSDRLVGSVTKVERAIPNSKKFIVKIDGEEWSVKSEIDLEVGAKVKVLEVSGPILEVIKV